MSEPGLVIDLFAGPGGWSVAARALGLDELGIEWDEAACATATAAGFRRLRADVAELDPYLIARGRPVVGLIASPPCQSFSMAGRGKGRAGVPVILEGVERIAAGHDIATVCKDVDDALDDDRAALVLEPLRWALELEPTWLAFEQVPPVLPLWEAFTPVLRAAGWNVTTGTLSAEQFDTPQTRRRAFLIAHRDRQVSLPAPVRRPYRKGVAQDEARTPDEARLSPWLSMADALGWGGASVLSNYSTGGDTSRKGMRLSEEPAATVTSHVDRNLWQYVNGTHDHAAVRDVGDPAPTVMFGQRANSVTWQHVAAGRTGEGRPRDIDEPAGAVTGKGTGYFIEPNTWRMRAGAQVRAAVRDVDEPSPTIIGGHDTAQRKWLAPEGTEAVRVTVEQAATLQGFPDGYPWRGTRTAQYRQVGDAVPPPLAWHVLRAATGLDRPDTAAVDS